jgi:hypothetical protein
MYHNPFLSLPERIISVETWEPKEVKDKRQQIEID